MQDASVARFVVLGACGFGVRGAIAVLSMLGLIPFPLPVLVGGAVGGASLCFFGRTEEALTRRVQLARELDEELAPLSLEEVLETLRTEWGAIAGPPEVVVEQIQACQQAGVEELMLEWFELDDIESAEAFAADVLSRL